MFKTDNDGGCGYLTVEVMLPNGHFIGSDNSGCLEVIMIIVVVMMIMIKNGIDS